MTPPTPTPTVSPSEPDKLRRLQQSNRTLVELNEEWAVTNQGLRARIAVLEKTIWEMGEVKK